MKDISSPLHWLPFIWVLFQAYLFLSMALLFLKRMKMLAPPVAGMEYGHVAIAGSVIAGVLFISTADIGSVFQAAKTLQYNGGLILQNTIMQFTQYFFVTVVGVSVFLITCFCNRRFLFHSKGNTNLDDGNIPWGILIACINIGFSIVLWFWLKEMAERITPEFINIR